MGRLSEIITVSLRPSTIDGIDAIAERLGNRKRSEVVDEACQAFIQSFAKSVEKIKAQ